MSKYLDGDLTVTAGSRLPDVTAAGIADRLYRLDGGHSLANDESVWTPGENVGRSIQFSSTCWLIQRGNQWLLWDTGVPESALNDPKGWSTLPKLIVYHLDKTLTAQLAEIGLRTTDITYVALSHRLRSAKAATSRPTWGLTAKQRPAQLFHSPIRLNIVSLLRSGAPSECHYLRHA